MADRRAGTAVRLQSTAMTSSVSVPDYFMPAARNIRS
jgi:hypothetical protein